MPDVSKLNLDGTSYKIKDDDARKYLVVVNNTSQDATKLNITTSSDIIELATTAEVTAAVNDEASARSSADSNLQSQINQIISPTGEAPSAAEVENARIGADGNVYTALGDAIRTNDNAFYAFVEGNDFQIIAPSVMHRGTYTIGDSSGNPTGAQDTTIRRRAYTNSIPFDLMDDDDVFIFNSNGTYNVAFVSFDNTGTCISTPRAWLDDGSYTKQQISYNSRSTGSSAAFSFQIRKPDDSVVPEMNGNDYSTLLVKRKLSIDSIENSSITEEKLSLEVRNKLNNTGYDDKVVDVILFMGQSNMAGRGTAVDAPSIIPDAGYEFRAISSPNALYNMAEPFGATEDNPSGIDDSGWKTGSLVTAFTNAYYNAGGKIPVVGISASKGGTPISDWQPNGTYLNDALNRLSTCVSYLLSNDYTIRHRYVLWCQGESDGDNNTTAANYKTLFGNMVNELLSHGIEKVFMIRIGHYNSGSSTKYETIINCQTDIAQTDQNVVMASTDFASMRSRGMMPDTFHYTQEAYNEVGHYSGVNVGIYVSTGKEATMYDPMTSNLYFSHKN